MEPKRFIFPEKRKLTFLSIVLIIMIITLPICNSFAEESTDETIGKYKQFIFSCDEWKLVIRNTVDLVMPFSIPIDTEQLNYLFFKNGNEIYLVVASKTFVLDELIYGKIMFSEDGEYFFLISDDGSAGLYTKAQK